MDEYGTLNGERFTISRRLPGPIGRVWDYLTDSELKARWFAGGATEPRVGGGYEMVFQHTELTPATGPAPEKYAEHQGMRAVAEITVWEPPHRLGFLWGETEVGASEVLFELSEAGEEVLLQITHSRLTTAEMRADVAGGWYSHLAILEARLREVDPLPDFWAIHARAEEIYSERF